MSSPTHQVYSSPLSSPYLPSSSSSPFSSPYSVHPSPFFKNYQQHQPASAQSPNKPKTFSVWENPQLNEQSTYRTHLANSLFDFLKFFSFFVVLLWLSSFNSLWSLIETILGLPRVAVNCFI